MSLLSEHLHREAKTIKELFELCKNVGVGVLGKIHILETGDEFMGYAEYRVYHADGYCLDRDWENVLKVNS